jgi:hypothetical protein
MRKIGTGNVGTIRRFGAGTSYGSGATVVQLQDWRLITSEDEAAVETAGYFDSLAGIMKVGERIFCTLVMGGTPKAKDYIVTANTGTAVTVAEADYT